MEPPESPEKTRAAVVVVFGLVLGACTIAPWVAHFMLGWWAGPLVWFALAALYDRLFVPKGSVCLGLSFVAPLASIVLLLVFDAVLFVQWLLT